MSALRAEIRRLDAASRAAREASARPARKSRLARAAKSRPARSRINPAMHLGLSWAAQMSKLPGTAKFLIGWALPPLR